MFGWALVWLAGTTAITGYSMTRHAPALERAMLDEVQDAVAPIGDAPIIVSVRDHEATLSGTVADASERDALLAAAGGALGIRKVVDRLALRDAVDAPTEVAALEAERTVEPDAGPAPEPTVDATAEMDAEPAPEPTADATAETDAEPAPEPTADATAEPDAGPAPEPTADATAEPGAGPAPEPTAEATAEMDAEPAPEPTADATAESDAEPAPEPTADATAESDAEPAPEPTVDATAEPDAEPAPEPTADATAEPDAEPAPEPTADATAESDAEPAPEPTVYATAETDAETDAEPAPEPTADATAETDAEPTAEAMAEPTMEPDPEPVPEATAEPAAEATAEPNPEPAAEPSAEAAAEPDPEPAAEAAAEPDVVGVAVEGDGDVASDVVELPDENDVPKAMESGSLALSDDTRLAELPPEFLPGDDETVDVDDSLALPSLRLDVVDGVLNIDGVLSDRDNPATLLDRAMEGLDLDYASEALELDAGVARADWLDPLLAVLPAFRNIDEPGIEIGERRITLRGTAPDAATRERLVEAVVERLGDFSLVERLTIAEARPTLSEGATDTAEATASQANSSAAALRAEYDALPNGRILFRSGSARLTPIGRARVDRIARVLAKHPDVPLAIEGHTDGRGLRANNLRLSQRRANAVRDRLMQHGIPRERLTTYGYGEAVPIADDATAEGRAANRRIEFIY